MRVIGKGKIIDFISEQRNSENSLNRWLSIVEGTTFANPNALKAVFPSADIVKSAKGHSLTIFNIHGNGVRLIASIDYASNTLRIRDILTHSEYDKEKWKIH